MKRTAGLIKLVVSIGLVAFVAYSIDMDKLRTVVNSIPLSIVIFVVAGYSLGQLLSSCKWWLIARAGGVQVTYLQALRAYFIGMFVNCFGLGTLGGDVVRGLLLAPKGETRVPALASVIADRAHGLAVLALIGGASTLLLGQGVLDPTLVISLSSLGLAMTAGWFIGPAIVIRFFPRNNRFRGKVEQMMEVFPRTASTLIPITALSFVFHLLQISLHMVMAIGVGADISWVYLLTIIPFVNILSTLPISWNGLGVRENAYVALLVPVVISKEQALAFGAMWLLSVTVASAIGGLAAFFSKDFASLKLNASKGSQPAAGSPHKIAV